MADCFVTGYLKDSAGRPMANRRVLITPERATVDDVGAWRSAEPVRVKTLDNGMWRVQLTPSDQAGLYTVNAVGATIQMWVPNARTCTFADAVTAATEGTDGI